MTFQFRWRTIKEIGWKRQQAYTITHMMYVVISGMNNQWLLGWFRYWILCVFFARRIVSRKLVVLNEPSSCSKKMVHHSIWWAKDTFRLFIQSHFRLQWNTENGKKERLFCALSSTLTFQLHGTSKQLLECRWIAFLVNNVYICRSWACDKLSNDKKSGKRMVIECG